MTALARALQRWAPDAPAVERLRRRQIAKTRPPCPVKVHWVPGSPSLACVALVLWMRQTDSDVAKIAKHLDCSWTKAEAIVFGKSAPTVLQAFALLRVAGVPMEWWREAA